MKKFILKLGDTGNLKLVFEIENTSIAKKWADEIDKNYPLYEIDRFKGFGGKDINTFIEQIQTHIDVVNNYAPNTIKNKQITGQDDLNYLHKFFENLRGDVDIGTVFYNNSPDNVKQSIDRFNVLIHELEHFTRDNLYPELVCTYQSPRYDLEDQDYDYFTFKWEFGSVYINYCEVGKPLLDVFKDKDVIVGNHNVKPLRYYKADFAIKFGPSTPDTVYNYRLEQFNIWYKNYPLKFDKLSLGMIPVAKINLKESGFKTNQHVINAIAHNQKVFSTCIK